MGHTAWTECGSSATPPSPSPNTGVTAFCRPSLVSPLPCSGASCSPASPSATSGPWCRASRAAWSSPSASVASTPSASRPSATPSSKPWARSSAACVWCYVKKSRTWRCGVMRMIGWNAVSFYTPNHQSWHLAYTFHNMPFSAHTHLWVSRQLRGLLPAEALWQLQPTAWFCDSSGRADWLRGSESVCTWIIENGHLFTTDDSKTSPLGSAAPLDDATFVRDA